MKPDVAYDYVKSIRPRVLLASAQWQAVREYNNLKVQKSSNRINATDRVGRTLGPSPHQELLAFDDGSVVVISKADLDSYDASLQLGSVGSAIWADLSVVYHIRVAGEAAWARISICGCAVGCIKGFEQLSRQSSCSIRADHLGAALYIPHQLLQQKQSVHPINMSSASLQGPKILS